MGNWRVTTVSTQADREALYAFRYEHYVERLAKDVSGTDHERRWLREPHDDLARHFLARDEQGETVGVLSGWPLNLPGMLKRYRQPLALDQFLEHFAPSQIVLSGRLAIAPAYQRTALFRDLLFASLEDHIRSGTAVGLIYCAPGLLHLYEKLGLRRYTNNFHTEGGSYRIPLFVFLDEDYLKRLRSPLRRVYRGIDTASVMDHRVGTRVLHRALSSFVGVGRITESSENIWSRIGQGGGLLDAPLFKGLTPDDLGAMLARGTVLETAPGDRVIREGELSTEAFVVVEGAFEARLGEDERSVHLYTFGAGDLFGELARLQDAPRSANVYSLVAGQLLVLNEAFLDVLRTTDPDLAKRLERNLSAILASRLAKANVRLLEKGKRERCLHGDLFQGLEDDEVEMIFSLLPRRRFEEGDRILRSGETGDEAFVLLSGRAQAVLGDEASGLAREPVVFEIVAGEAVGEMALLDAAPRSADVLALSAVEALSLSREAFDRLLERRPRIGQVLLRNLSRMLTRRLRQTTHRVHATEAWLQSSGLMVRPGPAETAGLDPVVEGLLDDYENHGRIDEGFKAVEAALFGLLEQRGYSDRERFALALNLLGSIGGWVAFLLVEKQAGRNRAPDFVRHLREAIRVHAKRLDQSDEAVDLLCMEIANAIVGGVATAVHQRPALDGQGPGEGKRVRGDRWDGEGGA